MLKNSSIISNLALLHQQVTELNNEINETDFSTENIQNIPPKVYDIINIAKIKIGKHLLSSQFNSGMPVDRSSHGFKYANSYTGYIKNDFSSACYYLASWILGGESDRKVSSLRINVALERDPPAHTIRVARVEASCNRQKRDKSGNYNINSFTIDYDFGISSFISNSDKKFNQENLDKFVKLIEPLVSCINKNTPVVVSKPKRAVDIYNITFPEYNSMNQITERIMKEAIFNDL